jgi:isoamylase
MGAAGQVVSDSLQTGSSSPLGATSAFAKASADKPAFAKASADKPAFAEASADEPGFAKALAGKPSTEGVNFSVFSKHATGVQLLLFDRVDDARAARIICLDPSVNRTYHYWHVFVPEVRPGQLYGYRVEGPFDPSNGMRFDPTKVLLDPYGRGLAVPENYGRADARHAGDNARRR